MADTYTLISSVTVGAGGSSGITFSSIPQTYTDLCVVYSVRSDLSAGTASLGIVLNTATTDTSYRWLRGNGSVAASGNDAGQTDFYAGEMNAATSTANTFTNGQVYIPNYTGSQQKSMSADQISENNATTAYAYFSAGLCTKTAAVTSLTVRPFSGSGSGNFVQYTTAYLYGIKNS